MLGVTHMFGGALLGAVAGYAVGQPQLGSFVGAVAALVPDVDEPESTLGRRLLPVSVLVNAVTGHRGFTHSFLFAGLVGAATPALAAWLKQPAPWFWGVAAFLGVLSHLLLDSLTPSGVQLLWPRKDRWSWKIRTGSLPDLGLALAEIAATVSLFSRAKL